MIVYETIKQTLPDPLFNILAYLKTHRELPALIRPKTFNQKVLYRKLFDRRPILSQFADKYAVRTYVGERVGLNLLPELYYVTTEPETIPFAALPNRFVVKPTHGSGWIELVPDKSKLDQEALIRTCQEWLTQSYYKKRREWVYKHITPRILIEEYIDDGHGQYPVDYKLFVYQGETAFIQVDTSRFEGHKRDFYTATWEKMPVALFYPNSSGSLARPRHFAEMLAAAKALGSDIDFLRIDFYDTEQKLYLGEITTTPDNGMGHFQPRRYDAVFGELWRVNR